MSTPLLYSGLHGTAMRYAADRRNLDDRSRSYATSLMAATTSWPKLQESLRDRGTPGLPLTLVMS